MKYLKLSNYFSFIYIFLSIDTCTIGSLRKEIYLNKNVQQNETRVLSIMLAGFENYSTNVSLDLCRWSKGEAGEDICKDSVKVEGKLEEDSIRLYLPSGSYSGTIDISYYTFRPLIFNYRANLRVFFGDARRLRPHVIGGETLSGCEWFESKSGERYLYYQCPELLLTDQIEPLKFENVESEKFNTVANFSLYFAAALGISASPPVYNAFIVPLIFGTGYFNNRIKFLNSNQKEPFINVDKNSY